MGGKSNLLMFPSEADVELYSIVLVYKVVLTKQDSTDIG